jgi:hypothetical protein
MKVYLVTLFIIQDGHQGFWLIIVVLLKFTFSELIDGMKQNLNEKVIGWFPSKIVSVDPINFSRW